MKITINSMWDETRRRPNVWLNVEGENDAEKALLLSLYSVKPKWIPNSNGGMLDFYPEGEK